MHTTTHLLLLCLVCTSTLNVASAARRALPSVGNSHREIMFLSGSIDTTTTPSLKDEAATRTTARTSDDSRDLGQFLVHLDGPVTQAAKATVNEALYPYALGDYVPHDTFIVVAPRSYVEALHRLPVVLWTGTLGAETKSHPNIAHHATAAVETTRARAEEAAYRTAAKWEREGRRDALPTPPAQRDVDDEPLDLIVVLTELPNEERVSISEAAAIVKSWGALPASILTASAASPNKALVTTSLAGLTNTLAFLTDLVSVSYVEVAPMYTVSNAHTRHLLQSNAVDSPFGASYPFFDAGLDGTDQIVAMGDSGLDKSHCFFRDGEDIAYGTDTNYNHRKIVNYNNYIDKWDVAVSDDGGHGTHVAGTVLGAAQPGQSGDAGEMDGMAPGAKMTVFDMGNENTPAAIYSPLDLYEDFFPPAYDVGARIHTNSWGYSPIIASSKQDTVYSSQSKDCDKFMDRNRDFVILVAAGNDGDYGASTIGAPATAKNVITVGATENTEQSWRDLCCLDSAPVCIPDLCSSSTINDVESGEYKSRNMAFFSSRGPLSGDDRVKPEVVAPGYYTISSKSNGEKKSDQCDEGDKKSLVNFAGTSMATPAVAGTVALLRQYFEEGFYPTGFANASNSFNPTGALLKAVLMNGGRRVNGKHGSSNLANKPIPNNFFGYGRVNLPRTVYLNTTAVGNFSLLILSNEDTNTSLHTDSYVEYCFNTIADTDEELVITLAWTDHPAKEGVAVALVNDLDLTVVVDGTEMLGNGGDDVNNHEQVRIDNVQSEMVCAWVNFTNIPRGPQAFALVVGGPVTGEFTTESLYASPAPPPITGTTTLFPAGVVEEDKSNVGVIVGASVGAFVVLALCIVGGLVGFKYMSDRAPSDSVNKSSGKNGGAKGKAKDPEGGYPAAKRMSNMSGSKETSSASSSSSEE